MNGRAKSSSFSLPFRGPVSSRHHPHCGLDLATKSASLRLQCDVFSLAGSRHWGRGNIKGSTIGIAGSGRRDSSIEVADEGVALGVSGLYIQAHKRLEMPPSSPASSEGSTGMPSIGTCRSAA